jgi:hypothetical protein
MGWMVLSERSLVARGTDPLNNAISKPRLTQWPLPSIQADDTAHSGIQDFEDMDLLVSHLLLLAVLIRYGNGKQALGMVLLWLQ